MKIALISIGKKKSGPPMEPSEEKGEMPFKSEEKGGEKPSGKVSKEEAGFRSADAVCGNCRHFDAGECEKVDVDCAPDDTCDLFEEDSGDYSSEDAGEEEEKE